MKTFSELCDEYRINPVVQKVIVPAEIPTEDILALLKYGKTLTFEFKEKEG
ncbi:MAG: hypothetical protein KKB31_05955 [Nanoarchaeota archaeon]|nr:hypothetical protein [Nanoarchaeota archaeon]